MLDGQEIRTTIESLYEVFASYSLPKHTDHCPCCVHDADDALIHSKPLRELSSNDLDRYIFKAISTWGDSALLRHFLPRMFELMLIPYGPGWLAVDHSIVVNKLRLGNWLEWPKHEQTAVRVFLHAIWMGHLARPFTMAFDVFEEPSDEWLCTIAQAEPILASYLSTWLLDDRPQSLKALALFITRSSIVHPKNGGRDAFWSQAETQYAELREWVRSRAVEEKLERAAIDKANGAQWRDCADALMELYSS